MEIKTGFLTKAGRHTFQAWRKRWFVLHNDYLKYYNPAAQYNDSNLLGTIQMVEIQSVKESKEKKHCFHINTRSRTYHMAASSDVERDDWMTAIRNCSANQRRIKDDSNAPPIYDEIGSNFKPSNDTNHSIGLYAQVQADPNTNPCAKKEVQVYDTFSKPPEYEMINDIQPKSQGKPRAQSLVPMIAATIPAYRKPRALSEGIIMEVPVVSGTTEVRDAIMNHDSNHSDTRNDEMDSIYKQIDESISAVYATDDDDDGADTDQPIEYDLPKPRDGCVEYAFDEIKRLILLSGESLDKEVDLIEISKKCNLQFDGETEYPATMLLDSYIKNIM